MLLRSIVAIVLSTLCIASSACVAVKPAVDTSENRAEHEATAKELRKRAQEGNVTAQNGLGLLYKVGQGVPQSYGQAKKWFEEAAKQGHAKPKLISVRCISTEMRLRKAPKWPCFGLVERQSKEILRLLRTLE
jgi:TPR repeat protein